MVFNGGDGRQQYTLMFEPGLVQRFRNLRDVLAQGVYKRGLKVCAAEMEMSPGNLSVALSDDAARHVSVDALERYIAATSDLAPIYYLVERFIGDPAVSNAQRLEEVQRLLEQMPELLHRAGIGADKKRVRK